jgi:oligopeptide/dipeptide ABC transporter ATP-binding protein
MVQTFHSALLQVKDLKTSFFTEDGVIKAVDGVNFSLGKGEILGLVGESGCGKSVTALSIMGLIGVPGKIVGGEILFEGQNLLALPGEAMRQIRGNQISMIFQQPQSSLNPVYTIGSQLAETFDIHTNADKRQAWEQSVELLRVVGIPDPEKKAHAYPHEMSGGQAQRVMIAMALALQPKILIADEPTTALDVTIQAQILDLILELRDQLGTAVILITHDLGLIAETADQVVVMYAGQIVEQAGVVELFNNPLHPYTNGLINSIPVLGKVKKRLEVIPGSVPNMIHIPSGCRFSPRCRERLQYGLTICTEVDPGNQEVSRGHEVRCWLYQENGHQENPISRKKVGDDG